AFDFRLGVRMLVRLCLHVRIEGGLILSERLGLHLGRERTDLRAVLGRREVIRTASATAEEGSDELTDRVPRSGARGSEERTSRGTDGAPDLAGFIRAGHQRLRSRATRTNPPTAIAPHWSADLAELAAVPSVAATLPAPCPTPRPNAPA